MSENYDYMGCACFLCRFLNVEPGKLLTYQFVCKAFFDIGITLLTFEESCF